ncbi:class I SAM-dependent methyltransferase [Cryobacterium sp. SO1]|uniref:class I SAM-dependent methyltransferase n=1 Tax=Cryobacterium sp. SO1 TaxID=1897061 RepID=UPI001023E571|nr:class I SAM-dependent methyltransferase [Cryobacterium sp. SO1]RZI34892.1 Malonyl-[acyl-carrier protein] O-methyltransferase [Cryobacterium sp. SO1]
MALDITAAYARRAVEYAEQLGSMTSVHPADLQLVTGWAERLDGPVIDAGCGPGHWTGYLAERGVNVRGVDLVPSFIDHARRAYPKGFFAVGDLGALPETAGTVAGVLAWYSLIHHKPGSLRGAHAEFARVLRPGGELLLGFFEGPAVAQFDHAVATAYFWPVDALNDELRAAHFDIIETHTRTGPGHRPHGAILARVCAPEDAVVPR